MAYIRPAGLNEKRCIVRENLGLYNNIITVGTYGGPRSLSQEVIVKALEQCVAEHPALSTIIREADTESPQLFRAGAVDVKRHLRYSSTHGRDVQEVLFEIHNDAAFRVEELPQWQVHVSLLDRPGIFFLAFACSHALMDGMSAYAFHHSFLSAIRGEAVNRREELPGPLEVAGDMQLSWGFLLGTVIKEYCPKVLAQIFGVGREKSAETWIGAVKRPDMPERGRVISTAVQVLAVPEEVIASALTVSRKHQARLTGLLVYLVARALSHALNSPGKHYSSFEAMTAIDLRGCLGTGKGQMANYVTAVTDNMTFQSSDPADGLSSREWTVVSQLTSRLSAASQTLANQPVGLLKYLNNFKAWTFKNARTPADTAFEVSNLGVFNNAGKEGNKWHLEEIVFSQSASGTGPALNFNTASVKGGSLMVTATWWPGMLGVEDETVFVQELLDAVHKMLQAIASEK